MIPYIFLALLMTLTIILYKINKNNDLPFELNAKFTDQDGTDLNGKYTLLNSSKQAVSQGTTIKDLVGQSFYISIPSSNIDDITKIKFSYTGSYRTSSKGFWTTTQNPDTVQPLVAVEKQETPLSGEKEVGVAKREFDLSLRKFISEVNGKEINREPTVDVSNLNKNIDGAKVTTATYNHNKKPVEVKPGDIVTYTIRVYNEGELDGYVGEITDYLPAELEFINDVENYPAETDFNAGYGWKIDASNNRVIKTNKLAYSSEAADRDQNASNLIKAYNGTTLDYKEVKVKCRVKNSTESLKKITNLAQITQETDSKGGAVTDRDSVPNGNFTLPSDTDLPTYKDDEINSEKQYIPGQEDDDDFEKVIIQEFDLALRKFISGKNGTTLIGREPSVDVTNLANGTATTATYNHPKDPLWVKNGSKVEYTIRVYNEGSEDGYAYEISDDIPEGLLYEPEDDTNKAYGWTMYREMTEEDKDIAKEDIVEYNGKNYTVTTKVEEATMIRTRYLEKTLIKAFDPETKTLSYADVKVVFSIKEPEDFNPDRIIINKAQITEDSGDDEDSTPNKWQDEDDEDIEKVRIPIFDLSLLKWVTQSVVTVDGKTTTTNTGFKPNQGLTESTGEDIRDNDTAEPIAKVELDKKKLKKTVVKFVYKIRVTNEGEIPGYATEVTDYIPEGLEFHVEDGNNKQYGWVEAGDDKIVTRALETVLLNPGESKELEITFRWINSEKNLGQKINIAEISEDANDYNTDDIDSTPNNRENPYKEEQEDDDDFALVILSIKTGATEFMSYFTLITIALAIIAGGIFLIKKYVLVS